MRKQDEDGRAPRAAGRAGLAGLLLLLVFACLNPRPEELPSGANETEPLVPGLDSSTDPGRDDPGLFDADEADDGARSAAPAEEPSAKPTAAPAPAPESAGAPAPDAGADAAPDAGSDTPDAG